MCSKSLIILLSILFSCRGGDLSKSCSELYLLFSSEKDEYHIKGIYNLNQDTLRLPNAANIIFEKDARIDNGVIYGNSSIIQSKSNKPIFKNTSFEGSFIGEPLVEWFSIIYNKKKDNSFELNAALDLAYHSSIKELKLPDDKVIYVRSDIDTNEKDYLRRGTVEIKSNVCFDLNHSTIKCLPNSAKQYNVLFSRESQNIIIRNGTIYGDKKKHTGKDGEWGYGIALQGVHGFVLENLKCCYCWGDGINIQVSSDGDGNPDSQTTIKGHCKDGIIRNVNCHHNRRQGISVEGIIGLEITNSSFCRTDGAKPQSGLDIEPYSPKNVAINIAIKNCVFKKNSYSGILMMSTDNNISHVLIDSCEFSSNRVCDVTMRGINITVRNCPVNQNSFSLKFVGDCKNINVTNSKLSNISAQDFTKGHYVRNVVFADCLVEIRKKRYAAFEEDLNLTNCDMVFYKCDFVFSEAIFEKGIFVFSGSSDNKYVYNNCFFDIGNNTLKVVNTQKFNDCKFVVKKDSVINTVQYLNGNRSSFNNCVVREE